MDACSAITIQLWNALHANNTYPCKSVQFEHEKVLQCDQRKMNFPALKNEAQELYVH